MFAHSRHDCAIVHTNDACTLTGAKSKNVHPGIYQAINSSVDWLYYGKEFAASARIESLVCKLFAMCALHFNKTRAWNHESFLHSVAGTHLFQIEYICQEFSKCQPERHHQILCIIQSTCRLSPVRSFSFLMSWQAGPGLSTTAASLTIRGCGSCTRSTDCPGICWETWAMHASAF